MNLTNSYLPERDAEDFSLHFMIHSTRKQAEHERHLVAFYATEREMNPVRAFFFSSMCFPPHTCYNNYRARLNAQYWRSVMSFTKERVKEIVYVDFSCIKLLLAETIEPIDESDESLLIRLGCKRGNVYHKSVWTRTDLYPLKYGWACANKTLYQIISDELYDFD